ncbi:unnamed protein product [Arctia plantaginis]|uniref:Androgen-dependent TFPI-regulating protein n=1 Tax=Arctia plantaginis TaxID=874455 RepID=A0A8S1A7B2_ARCPL|nr:unnamed protein product [Arctia plantaginis]
MTETKIGVPIFEQEKSVSYCRFYLRVVFHIVSVIIFWFVIGYAVYIFHQLITEAVEVEDPQVWTLKWLTPCYVTNWNFLFQTCFLTMSLAYDLLEWIDRHESYVAKLLKYYRDLLFSGIVVPLTLFISSMFWILYWIDRELVFPRVYDQIVPWWFNHCVHTNILIVIGLETLLQARRYPANRKVELWLNGFIGIAYAIVYYSIFFIKNRWLYGVFGIMTWWQVCLYQILIWASTFVFYFIQFPINRLFHKEEVPKSPEQKTDNQNTEGKTDAKSMVPDSWSLKFRPKTLIENSFL